MILTLVHLGRRMHVLQIRNNHIIYKQPCFLNSQKLVKSSFETKGLFTSAFWAGQKCAMVLSKNLFAGILDHKKASALYN